MALDYIKNVAKEWMHYERWELAEEKRNLITCVWNRIWKRLTFTSLRYYITQMSEKLFFLVMHYNQSQYIEVLGEGEFDG